MGKVKGLMIEREERTSNRKRIKELESLLEDAELKCLFYEENLDRKLLEKSHKNNKELRKKVKDLESQVACWRRVGVWMYNTMTMSQLEMMEVEGLDIP
eukprot:SAG22_NODE_677_length_7962_cov_53.676078_3_plen_99_part_00